MPSISEDKSINESLNIIKKALEDSDYNNENNLKTNEDELILNKLIKDDGTISIINNDSLNENEIKKILKDKLSEIFDEKFEKWLDKNLPNFIEKYLSKNK